MLPVSTDFQNAITADYRKIRAKVIVDYEGPYVANTFQVSANDADPLFDINQAADAVDTTEMRIAVLDGTWRLGDDHLYSPYVQAGWWTQKVADGAGNFVPPYPTLTIQMVDRTIDKLRVVGDTIKGEYPIEFAIRLYDYGGNLLHEELITDNNQVVWEKAVSVVGVYKAELELHIWSRPNTKGKIVEFISPIYEVYQGDEIISLELTEERELRGTTLPIGNISLNELRVVLVNDGRFNLDNTTSILYNRLKPNCRVRAWIGVELTDGTTEWVPLGVFWTVDWKVSEKDLTAEFTARDKLQRLSDTNISLGILQDTTLYDIAEAVFQDAGLSFREYAIDDAFKDIAIPWAYFPSTSHLNALKTIAAAGLGVVYADRYGIIQMRRIAMDETGDPVAYITADDYFKKDTPLLLGSVYTRIRVRTQPLQPAAVQEVYRSLEPVVVPAGSSVSTTIFFLQQPVINPTATLEGATNTTITATTWYSWGGRLTLTNSGTTDESVIIVVNGQPLTVQGAELVEKEDAKAITDYGLIVYTLPNNPLIQSRDIAKQIAETLLASYKDPKRAIVLTWRGNPALELGDKIDIDGQAAYIVRQTLTYDGGLTVRTETRNV